MYYTTKTALGFSNSVSEFLESYLYNRTCSVHYNGFSSTTFTASSEVPQGSNLGSLLFSFDINDLLSLLDCKVLAYADSKQLVHHQ